MDSPATVYLVTGANRGIGLALVEQLLLKPDSIVFAGVRDPASATALKPSKRLHILEVVSSDVKGNKEALEKIKSTTGRLDVVIANAGICSSMQSALETEPAAMVEHFNINTIGPLVLFQATYPLLKTSTNPKFAVISSGAGSIQFGATLPINNLAYATSKAAVNYVTMKIRNEHPEIVFPISPGFVDTDMVANAKIAEPKFSYPEAITPTESARAIVGLVDNATGEKEERKFVNYDGTTIPW